MLVGVFLSAWMLGFLVGASLTYYVMRPPRPPKGPLRDAFER